MTLKINSAPPKALSDIALCLAPKATVMHYEINESIATVKKTSLFVSLNRSHCTETLQWVAKSLGQKRQWSFFISKSLKLGHMYLISIICLLVLACSNFLANKFAQNGMIILKLQLST